MYCYALLVSFDSSILKYWFLFLMQKSKSSDAPGARLEQSTDWNIMASRASRASRLFSGPRWVLMQRFCAQDATDSRPEVHGMPSLCQDFMVGLGMCALGSRIRNTSPVEHSSNEIHGIAKRLSWDRLGLDRLTWRQRMSEKFKCLSKSI